MAGGSASLSPMPTAGYAGFAEGDLVSNRTPVLLHGAGVADRRSWAEEAAARLGAPFREALDRASLTAALKSPLSVVYVPDLAVLGLEAQTTLLQLLHGHADRPKLVLGLATSIPKAEAAGTLRSDLAYRLRLSQLDLGNADVRTSIQSRRSRREKKAQASAPSQKPAASRPASAKRAASARR